MAGTGSVSKKFLCKWQSAGRQKHHDPAAGSGAPRSALLYCTKWPLGSQQIHLAICGEETPETAAKPLGAVASPPVASFEIVGQVPLVCLCLSFPTCKMGTITIVTPSDSWEWDTHTSLGKAAQHPHMCSVHVPVCCYLPASSHWTFSVQNTPAVCVSMSCVCPTCKCARTLVWPLGLSSCILWQWMILRFPVWNLQPYIFDTLYISPIAPVRSFMDENILFFNFLLYIEHSWLTIPS